MTENKGNGRIVWASDWELAQRVEPTREGDRETRPRGGAAPEGDQKTGQTAQAMKRCRTIQEAEKVRRHKQEQTKQNQAQGLFAGGWWPIGQGSCD